MFQKLAFTVFSSSFFSGVVFSLISIMVDRCEIGGSYLIIAWTLFAGIGALITKK